MKGYNRSPYDAYAGRIYYTVQQEDERESLRYSAAYLYEKVTEVIHQINALPDVDQLTLADKHRVNDCKVAYNKLHPTVRSQVTNFDRLVLLLDRMEELKKDFNNGN